MWRREKTASQIATALGGVGRNAVIGKAHRLGLQSRPSSRDPKSDTRPHLLEQIEDPLLGALGGSVVAADLLDRSWPDGTPYLDKGARAALVGSIDLAGAERSEPIVMATAADLVSAIAALGNPRRKGIKPRVVQPYLKQISAAARPASFVPPKLERRVGAGLRWDVVQVLVEAATMRSRLNPHASPIELPHLIGALVATPAGQAGVLQAMPIPQGFEQFRSFAASVYDNYAAKLKLASARGVATLMVREIDAQGPFRGPRVDRAGYSSDHVDAQVSDPDLRKDARALADLILLEAAAPPLAIGVFGPWGSGKSTLLAALKQEISAQVEDERNAAALGHAIEDPAIRRVSGVMQLEFNAWTFADSENLWASLTSDIFEQIAAGGKDAAQARVGARLVAEVAERTSEETELLRAAQANLAESRARIRAAATALEAAERDERLSLVDAAFDVAKDLLVKVKIKDDETSDGDAKDAARTQAESPEASGTSGKAAMVKAEADPLSQDKKPQATYLKVFQDALLIGEGIEAQRRISNYAEAGGSMVRASLMVKDYLLAQPRGRLGLGVAACVALAIVAYFVVPLVLPLASPVLKLLTAVAVGTAALIGSTWVYALPAFHVAGLLNAKLKERSTQARAKRASAQAERNKAQADEAEARRAIERSRCIVEKYADVREVGSAPGLMLDYLLEESAEIARLRGSLGTLGTVRKAFEKLNTLVQAHAQDRNSPVQRIIIYIDDLDRCSGAQVVQILEAIHLLLAFPCFVVVAAVDARWLTSALSSTHGQLDGQRGVTPADYLEKIFQIPYWVRPLRTDSEAGGLGSYGRLINELTGNQAESAQKILTDEEEKEDDLVQILAKGWSPLRQIEPLAPQVDLTPERKQLRFNQAELRLFHDMGGLAARSPRAVKRMINIYRLLRVSALVRGASVTILDADGHPAPGPLVQFALACEAGLPSDKATQLAEFIAAMNADEWQIWASALEDEGRLIDSAALTKIVGDAELRIRLSHAFRSAAGIVEPKAQLRDLKAAFMLAGRYGFRMPTTSVEVPGANEPDLLDFLED